MKTTIDFPPDLLRQARVAAAVQGTTLRTLVVEALQEHLAKGASPAVEGWRAVAGTVLERDLEEVDAAIASEFSAIDIESWQ